MIRCENPRIMMVVNDPPPHSKACKSAWVGVLLFLPDN